MSPEKCPCEDCLLLPMCKNRSTTQAINLINATEKCYLLKDFLNITEISKSKISKRYTDFNSNLSRAELEKRLDQLDKYLPLGTLHIINDAG